MRGSLSEGIHYETAKSWSFTSGRMRVNDRPCWLTWNRDGSGCDQIKPCFCCTGLLWEETLALIKCNTRCHAVHYVGIHTLTGSQGVSLVVANISKLIMIVFKWSIIISRNQMGYNTLKIIPGFYRTVKLQPDERNVSKDTNLQVHLWDVSAYDVKMASGDVNTKASPICWKKNKTAQWQMTSGICIL